MSVPLDTKPHKTFHHGQTHSMRFAYLWFYGRYIYTFVRITHFLRYISWFTRYASVVNRGNSSYTKFETLHIHFEWLKNAIPAMFSSNLTRDYHVRHQCTPFISILVFDAATFVWITKMYFFFIFIYLLPIVPVRLRWCNFKERQNVGIFVDIKLYRISFWHCKIQLGQL